MSMTVTTNNASNKIAEVRYKAQGENDSYHA